MGKSGPIALRMTPNGQTGTPNGSLRMVALRVVALRVVAIQALHLLDDKYTFFGLRRCACNSQVRSSL
jgi:hypothetical protein